MHASLCFKKQSNQKNNQDAIFNVITVSLVWLQFKKIMYLKKKTMAKTIGQDK